MNAAPEALAAEDLDFARAESYTRLGRALDALAKDGHIDDPEETSPGVARRVRITRTYLWLLGYLRRDDGDANVDAELHGAIAAFQTELGRTATGAMDDASWAVLLELASFDTPIDSARWLATEQGSRAFRRAIELRLFSYGLLPSLPTVADRDEHKTRKRDKAYQEAITAFARVAALTGLTEAPLVPTPDAPLCSALFDHTAITDAMRHGAGEFIVQPHHPELPLGPGDTKRLLRRFREQVALVELWLLGYDVRPGVFAMDGAHARDANGTLNSALQQFAADREIAFPDRASIVLGPWFFLEARNLQRLPAEPDDIEDTAIDELLADPKRMRLLDKTYRSLGARFIDGVKRAVAWIGHWFRRAFRLFQQLVTNFARALHGGAQVVYVRMRAVVRTVRIGMRYFFGAIIEGSDPSKVFIGKHADFDLDVVIAPDTTAAAMDQFFLGLHLRVRAMELAGAILGHLLALLRMTLRGIDALLGWLGIIIALVRLGKWLRRSAVLSREAFALMSEVAALEASAETAG